MLPVPKCLLNRQTTAQITHLLPQHLRALSQGNYRDQTRNAFMWFLRKCAEEGIDQVLSS